MTTRHAGILTITTEALQEALHLPKGAVIQCVHQDPNDMFVGRVQLLITDDERLPEVPEGAIAPPIETILQQVYHENCGHSEVTFEGWWRHNDYKYRS